MTRRFRGMVCVFLLGAVPIVADEAAKTPPATVEMVARFHDGTTIRKAVLQESVLITTRYGKLTVPVGDIRRIEFGLHISEETVQKIDEAIRNLGSDKFPLRESASKDLVALGFRAYAALQTAVKSKDKEVVKRAAAALEKIRVATPDELLRLKNHDVIHTRDCVLSGTIHSPILKAKTANFGELQFKIADLHSLQSMAKAEAEVAVEAAPAAQGLKWQDTGIQVESDMDLVIKASGQIDFANGQPLPPGAGPIVSGPEGSANVGRGTGGYSVGTLLGKIGDRGDVFVIGPRLEGKTVQEGRLHLMVVPWPGAENPPTGSYKVNLAMGFDLVPGLKRIEAASFESSRTTGPTFGKKKGFKTPQ